jgi:hypothetical protein
MPWFSRSEEENQAALEKASRNPSYQYCVALEEQNGGAATKRMSSRAASAR